MNWLWSPYDVDKHGVPHNALTAISDAGMYDDIGHLPLLRRKVKKIVLYCHTTVAPDFENEVGPEKINLEADIYIKAAFGAPGGLNPPNPPGAPNVVSAVDYLKVFDGSEFLPLWTKMKALKEARVPVVLRETHTVVDNPHYGIEGGWKVEVVWVVQTPIDEFFYALPNKTREQLLKKDYFPNYGAGDPRSHFEMSAISQYSSWMTHKAVVKEVKAMLDNPSAELV